MVNVVQSIGYGIGKLHTGLIRYLCDHWNDGRQAEIQPFFDKLDIRLNGIDHLETAVEEKGVDLLIRGAKDGTGARLDLAMIEMKVDDHEHQVNKSGGLRGQQTEVYPNMLPGFARHLFLTLGVGEFYRPPVNTPPFHWVRLQEFADAVRAVTLRNKVVSDWLEMLDAELQCRRAAASATELPANVHDLRSGVWNLNVLGAIKKRLIADANLPACFGDVKAYPFGSRPDTILNFSPASSDGGPRSPFYAEINYGGRLSIKARLSGIPEVQKHRFVDTVRNHYKKAYRDSPLKPAPGRVRLGKTLTMMSFDIGLSKRGPLRFSESVDKTCDRIIDILTTFSSSPLAETL